MMDDEASDIDSTVFCEFHDYLSELHTLYEWSVAISDNAPREEYWAGLVSYMGSEEDAEEFEHYSAQEAYSLAYEIAGHTEVTINQQAETYLNEVITNIFQVEEDLSPLSAMGETMGDPDQDDPYTAEELNVMRERHRQLSEKFREVSEKDSSDGG